MVVFAELPARSTCRRQHSRTMKFELKPYNRGLPDEELLDDLRAVAQRLNKDFVTAKEYNDSGRLCADKLQKRFQSWGAAHERAGLTRINNYQATADDCIEEIKRVANLLKTDSITGTDYQTHGRFNLTLISRRIGYWKEAVTQAGLRVSDKSKAKITDEELFENLERLWEALARQPTGPDYVKPQSCCSYSSYRRRFGGTGKRSKPSSHRLNKNRSNRLKRST